MSDPAYIAGTVANWAELPGVGKLSKELTEKLDLLDSVNHSDTYVPVPSLDKLTPVNTEKIIADHAQALAAKSRFDDARQAVRHVVVSSVLELARAEVPSVIEKMTPAFDAAVSAYVDAVECLPDELSSDALVAAGPATLEAYQAAVGAAQVLSQVNSWVTGLNRLAGVGGAADFSVQILAPRSRRELDELDRIKRDTRTDAVAQQVVPVFQLAARRGIPFEIHSPGEAQILRAELEAQPVAEPGPIRGQW